jgi:hypothetical protein
MACSFTSPQAQTPEYGVMWEQADTFCKETFTALEHLTHLKVRVRGAFSMIILAAKGRFYQAKTLIVDCFSSTP